MAITFESVKDPYGLGSLSQTLADAYLQKNLMDLEKTKKIEEEERQKKLRQKDYSALGKTIEQFAPKEKGETWDDNRIANFMSQALESGASMGDILNTIKAFQTKPKVGSIAQTPFMKETAKTNVQLIKNLGEHGRKAKEMLGAWDELDSAIADESRADNPVSRGLKMLPGASLTYSPEDQTIASYGKEIISNFTNMKNLRLTDAKLRWLEGIAPAPWKSKEANMQASAYFKRMAQIQEAYGDISSELANAYTQAGLDLPPNFEKILEDAVDPLRKEIDALYKMSTKSQEMQPESKEVGSTFKKMPNAKEYEGAEITDSKGNRYVSNGVKWSKVK